MLQEENQRHAAVLAYLKKCPYLQAEALGFNALSPSSPEGLLTDSYDVAVKQYTSGGGTYEYTFTFARLVNYDSEGTSTLNLDTINSIDTVARWIEEQNRAKVYPFKSAYKVRLVRGGPVLAATDEKGTAKYQLTVIVSYQK